MQKHFMFNYKSLFKPKGKKKLLFWWPYSDIMKEIIKSLDSQRKWHPFTRWMVAAYNQNSEIRFYPTLEWNYGSESRLFLVSFFFQTSKILLVSGLTSKVYEFLFHWVKENILFIDSVLTTPISIIFNSIAGFFSWLRSDSSRSRPEASIWEVVVYLGDDPKKHQ